VSWSPSGHLATACGDNAVRVFRRVGKDLNAPKFELAASVQRAHDEDVNAVSWSPQPQGDGVSLLASASDDGTVKIWRFTAAS
jgi:WD40 repeat protein